MACYKSDLIDLELRQENKGQAMEINLNFIPERLHFYDPVKGIVYVYKTKQPDRLKRSDTKGEAIVGSAKINKIAEASRND
jgi:hypothetical protein